ncbi:MAG: transporter substrate-binding domain-containing protein [Actinobacteria bacterium]|nr:transporter substrate-binding domain-containing protein [Actinomycetota bacterium]MSY73495.1 transporter substrate-binding domain-containing protein [Actinomycetota bacterium]
MCMKTRWFRRFLLPVLAIAMVAASCGDDGGSTSTTPATTVAGPPQFAVGTTMATIQARGKMILGTKFDQPLFGLKNPTNNQVEGFDVEIGKIIARAIFGADGASKIDYQETTSKVREDAVKDGKVDIVVATYTINDARKQIIDFAGPYYVAGQDILVKKTNTTITGVESLAGKKVCTVQGSTSLTNIQAKAPQADVSITFDKYSLCVEALKDGRVDAVTTDNIILLGFINDDPTNLKLVNKPFTTEPYGIGVKKGDTAFRAFVNDTLEKAYADGSWKKAWDATAGKTGQAAPTPPPVNRYA